MHMNNLDDKTILSQNIVNAIKTNDETQIAKAFEEYAQSVHDTMMYEIENGISAVDTMILARRNQRQLTSSEVKFYTELISALKSDEPKKNITALSKKISVKQAVDNLDVAYPETIFESVIDDIRQSHELLQYIDFRYTTILTKWIRNTATSQLAQWGKINSKITKELEGSIDEIDVGMNKLTAWIPVYKDMLDLGPAFVDTYVREILREAIALAIETAIVCGDGADCPIGMNRDISKDVSVIAGAYPEKTPISVASFEPEAYGQLLSSISKHSVTGKNRKIENLILVVNPNTYLTKVMPATSMLVPGGGYAKDIFPVKTIPIQSVAVEDGKAILGLGKNYFFGLGSSKEGLLEYSDDVKFLEDLRVFKIKTFGNGRASDDNDFLYLDISKLKPLTYKVVNA